MDPSDLWSNGYDAGVKAATDRLGQWEGMYREAREEVLRLRRERIDLDDPQVRERLILALGLHSNGNTRVLRSVSVDSILAVLKERP